MRAAQRPDLFRHAEIDPAFEGRGLSGELVKAALDAEREARRPIVPLCPLRQGLRRASCKYQELVDGRMIRRDRRGVMHAPHVWCLAPNVG